MEEKDVVFTLSYEDVGTYLCESLIRIGYVPEADEMLDLTDIVMDLILSLHTQMGGEVVHMNEEDED